MPSLWPDQQSYISAPPPAGFLSRKTRRLAVMGSTGSIGRNVLAVAESAGARLQIHALAGGRNVRLLAEQANHWHPPFLGCIDNEHGAALRKLLNYTPQILTGQPGFATIASMRETDCVVSAQVGAAGLSCTLAAAFAGKVIALANKESLVLAGALLRKICHDTAATILPVDSEHYAIFQCLAGRPSAEIKKLVLTASGGPFLGKSAAQTRHAGPEDALKHPNWNMGAKISIDSATLMNKGLEFIEAVQLYGVSSDQVGILVHPQSIVHSLVEFQDNSLMAQLATPDMRLPIAGCLLWPRATQSFVTPLNLAAIGQLNFLEPDYDTFPCLGLAISAGKHIPDENWRYLGLNPACIALNAANEAAVELFLGGQCKFGQIGQLIETALKFLVFENPPACPQMAPALGPVEKTAELTGIVGEIDQATRRFVKNLAS